MKLLKISLSSLALLLLFSSCNVLGDNEDDFQPTINIEDLPEEVTDYIEANFRDYSIDEAELEDYCDDVTVYKVELEDGPGPDIEAYFDADGQFLFSATEVSIEELPDAVIEAIETEFPDYRIEDDDDDIEQFELAEGGFQYEVELETVSGDGDEITVIFNQDGSIFCTEEDDDDDDEEEDDGDDDDDGEDDLPESVRDFISENYPDYEIEEVEKEDELYLCEDDTEVYQIELEDGPGPDVELYFSLDWEFILAATEVSEEDLPEAVIATLETDFPDYEIEDDDIEQYEFEDGSLQFLVELETDDGDDIEIVIDENGNIVCRED